MPVNGAAPITARMFTAAWPHTRTVKPAASRFPNGSLQRSARFREPVHDAEFMETRRDDRLAFEQHFGRQLARQSAREEPRAAAIRRQSDARV